MPVSTKRKHTHKRKKQNNPNADSGYIARFHLGGIDIPEGMLDALHNEGIAYHKRGREDKASGAAMLTLNEFSERLCTPEPGLPEFISQPITEAQYTQYIDGYTGQAYRERVIFRKDD